MKSIDTSASSGLRTTAAKRGPKELTQWLVVVVLPHVACEHRCLFLLTLAESTSGRRINNELHTRWEIDQRDETKITLVKMPRWAGNDFAVGH
jgi:hypothetical protein